MNSYLAKKALNFLAAKDHNYSFEPKKKKKNKIKDFIFIAGKILLVEIMMLYHSNS